MKYIKGQGVARQRETYTPGRDPNCCCSLVENSNFQPIDLSIELAALVKSIYPIQKLSTTNILLGTNYTFTTDVRRCRSGR